jgi:hypothetical protein
MVAGGAECLGGLFGGWVKKLAGELLGESLGSRMSGRAKT